MKRTLEQTKYLMNTLKVFYNDLVRLGAFFLHTMPKTHLIETPELEALLIQKFDPLLKGFLVAVVSVSVSVAVVIVLQAVAVLRHMTNHSQGEV